MYISPGTVSSDLQASIMPQRQLQSNIQFASLPEVEGVKVASCLDLYVVAQGASQAYGAVTVHLRLQGSIRVNA